LSFDQRAGGSYPFKATEPNANAAHIVLLYFSFPLRLRMFEDLLAARGIIVLHQTVRL
jgi:putative transposase